MILWRVLFLVFNLWFSSPPALSETELKLPTRESEPNPFAKSYWHAEFCRNYPEGFTQATMTQGNLQPSLTYLYDVDNHWIMGLGGSIKLFYRRPDTVPPPPSHSLALYTLTHETLYALRLSHPLYLLLGPKIQYLLPALNGKPPPQRDSVYEPEIGVAFSMQLAERLDEHWLATLRIDRWRGTKTSRLVGLEIAAGLAWARD